MYDVIHSRRGATVESYKVNRPPAQQFSIIKARLRYWDGPMLQLSENLLAEGVRLRKLEYAYHYQKQDGSLIFRYDNVPHYPELPTHPHHKHVKSGAVERVEAAQPPQLTDVLREIDAMLASSQ
jgi:hypothetical protein